MTVREHMALTLAATQYRWPARRDADVREWLGWSPTVFWLRVAELLDRPDAESSRPAEVRRLRRLREVRRGARVA